MKKKRNLTLFSRLGLISLLAAFCLSFGLEVAQADPFALGDIFASTGNGTIQHYNSAGTLLETLNTGQGGFTTGSAFDGSGNLYVTNFSADTVSKFSGPGDPHTASLFGSGYNTPESIVFDASGNVFVGNLGNGIRQYDSTGVFQRTVINTQVDWFDLTADQSTIYFTQEGGQIKTVDVATGTLGPNFSNSAGTFALRILSDGGVLVADRSNVKRLDSTGAVIQTYDVAGENSWFALNLDPDGTSFWSGNFGTGNLYKFDIDSGAQLQTINTGATGNLFGVSLFGEITAGGPPPKAQLPIPGTLVVFGSGLAALGLLRWRIRQL